MNKKLLATLIIPLLGMTACGGNDFKEVVYFADSYNGVVVAETGYKRSGFVVATYTLEPEDLEYITTNIYSNFPSSFAIANTYSRNADSEELPPEITTSVHISGTSFNLKRDKSTISFYETYSDVAYNEGKRIARFVTHEDVKTADSAKSYAFAYLLSGGSTLTIETKSTELPTSSWSVKMATHSFAEKVSERLVQYADYEAVYYTFK